MAIEKTQHLYELLFRFNLDGTVAGHRKDLERVADTETGQVYSARETDPLPIAGAEIEAVIGPALAATAADLQAKTKALFEMTLERDSLRRQLDALRNQPAA